MNSTVTAFSGLLKKLLLWEFGGQPGTTRWITSFLVSLSPVKARSSSPTSPLASVWLCPSFCPHPQSSHLPSKLVFHPLPCSSFARQRSYGFQRWVHECNLASLFSVGNCVQYCGSGSAFILFGWIRIQIRIGNTDPDSRGPKWTTKVKKIQVLKC